MSRDPKAATAVVACAVALVVSVALGVAFGSGSATLSDVFEPGTRAHAIVVGYRLPRVLLAVMTGAGLSAVGAAFQSVLRNPLAEPYVLGVSGGAALGATGSLVFGAGMGLFGVAAVPASAFAGAAGAAALVWWLSHTGQTAGYSILLAGVVVNAIAGATITLLEAIAEPGRVQSLLWWLMGFLDVPSWGQLAFVTVYVAVGLSVLMLDAGRMNLLGLGDEVAESLGLDVRALQRRTFFACAAVVGAIVSITGMIGFVGLVVPQAVRRVTGPDLRIVLPASALAGAATLTMCDLLVRVLSPWLHTEVPVGAVTAMAGGPVFLALLRKRPAAAG